MARKKTSGRRSEKRRVMLARAGMIPAGGARGRAGEAGPGAGAQGRSTAIAGIVVRRGKSLEVEPIFQQGPPLPMERCPERPHPGDLVLYTFSYGYKARVIRILGKSSELRDVMDALLADRLLHRGFSPKVLAEAGAAVELHEKHDSYRADLRKLFTFTIDPAMAQDYDDALSFEQTPDDTTIVYVHIADVSYFIHEETALDREALRRGNSVYVATGAEPMLPPMLSSNVCSLLPGEDRKTVTVEMEIDRTGRVLSTKFYRSLVRNDRRLDYEQVERMFQGKQKADPELAAAFELGRALAKVLREQRHERGSLRIESTEPEFEWDEKGRVIAADPGEELESHWFIEVFMVLANEQVASYLEREHVPTVYRVHDLPDPFHVDHLLDVLTSLGLPTPPFDPMQATPREVRRVMRETAEWVDSHTPEGKGKAALVQQVLRAQSRAVYQTMNIGHFGLASDSYCHFTSPIRRYPDLLVHRGLLGALQLGPKPTTSILGDWAEHCSQTEREAAKIELLADDIALAHLLRRRLDEDGWYESVFEGQILSLTHRGMFVLFDRLFEGYLPVSELPRDTYRLNDLETALEGKRGDRAYKIADLVQVRVAAIDEVRGRVDLSLATEEAVKGGRPLPARMRPGGRRRG